MESASRRSICHMRTEPVWPRGSLEEAELDQEPDRADDRDKPKQQPPAGFVTVGKSRTRPEGGWVEATPKQAPQSLKRPQNRGAARTTTDRVHVVHVGTSRKNNCDSQRKVPKIRNTGRDSRVESSGHRRKVKTKCFAKFLWFLEFWLH
jgi:hypothetical protein